MTNTIVTSAEPPASEHDPSRLHRIHFDGDPAGVGRVLLRNVVLSLLTLGFYRFWGRVRMRRYLWQHFRLSGHRLAYTGTGGELFVGFLKFVVLVALFIGLSMGLEEVLPPPWPLLAQGLLFSVLAPPLVFLARRYRLSRTRLCNIAFGMRPGLMAFWGLSLRGTAVSLLTFGWMAPVFAERKHKFIVEHSMWGDQAMGYDAAPEAVRRTVLRALPLLVVTFGLYTLWLSADLARFRARRTHLGGARLAVDYTGGDTLSLAFTSTLATLFSLGIALPWVICRSARFVARHVWIEGELPLDGVAVRPTAASATFDGGDLGIEI